MTDRHVAGDLGVYLAGALDRHESWSVEAHLSTCRSCATELGELREVTALLDGDAAGGAVGRPSGRR